MNHHSFMPREQRTAILTFDNGQRVRAEIFISKSDRPIFHDNLERRFKEDFHKSQPRALVRDSEDGVWKAGYFSNYDEDDVSLPYICVGSLYKLCIPYEGNEYLLGTDKSHE